MPPKELAKPLELAIAALALFVAVTTLPQIVPSTERDSAHSRQNDHVLAHRIDLSSALSAASVSSQTFNSLDTGNWTSIGPDGNSVRKLFIDPNNPLNLYAVGEWGSGLFKSSDGGVTWNAVTAGFAFGGRAEQDSVVVSDLVLDSATTSILYASAPDGIYKSTNAGSSWTRISSFSVSELEIDPINRLVLYGGVGDGVIKAPTGAGHGCRRKTASSDW
jgi:hypothetical protein